MNEINFLPVSYLQRRVKRKRVMVESVLVALLAVALLSMALSIRSSAAALTVQAHDLETKLADAQAAVSELGQMEQEHRQLEQQLRIQRELVQSVNQTQILATLSELLPSAAAITDMRINVHRRAPEPYRTKEEIEAMAKNAARARARAAAPAIVRQYVEVDLSGVAAQENDLADFLAALSHHPIFSNIKVHYSRNVDFMQLQARDFRMTTHVPLDREYRPINQEFADANRK